jgi:hypothetical protein
LIRHPARDSRLAKNPHAAVKSGVVQAARGAQQVR